MTFEWVTDKAFWVYGTFSVWSNFSFYFSTNKKNSLWQWHHECCCDIQRNYKNVKLFISIFFFDSIYLILIVISNMYVCNPIWQEINYDSPRGRVAVRTHANEWTTSYLLIHDADITDSGIYTCAPTSGGRTSIKVHVFLHGNFWSVHKTSPNIHNLTKFHLQASDQRRCKQVHQPT